MTINSDCDASDQLTTDQNTAQEPSGTRKLVDSLVAASITNPRTRSGGGAGRVLKPVSPRDSKRFGHPLLTNVTEQNLLSSTVPKNCVKVLSTTTSPTVDCNNNTCHKTGDIVQSDSQTVDCDNSVPSPNDNEQSVAVKCSASGGGGDVQRGSSLKVAPVDKVAGGGQPVTMFRRISPLPVDDGLPPIENCDHNANHRLLSKSKSHQPAQSVKSVPKDNSRPHDVDWRSKLNQELTAYQTLLNSTSRWKSGLDAVGQPVVANSNSVSESSPSSSATSSVSSPSTGQQDESLQSNKSSHDMSLAEKNISTAGGQIIKRSQTNQPRSQAEKVQVKSGSSGILFKTGASDITEANPVATPSEVVRPESSEHTPTPTTESRSSTPFLLFECAPLRPQRSCDKEMDTRGRSASNRRQQDKQRPPPTNSPSSPPLSASRPRSSSFKRNVTVITPYHKVLQAMEHDKTWHKEVAYGRRVGLYRFRGDIGNGNFSQVKIAVHTLTREKVAVKILDKSRLDAKTQKMLGREIRTMETLHHPNLIRIFEVIETLSKHFIVMELAPGGELFQVITTHGRFNESEAKFYFSQIVSAIEHMHQHNLIHRDIKAENVFFADSRTIKVGDFGFSTRISSHDELLSTFCGSPPYAAPELFRDESYRGPYVDYWALGVLLYFIVTATMPFRAQTIVSLKKLILECRYDIPAYVSVECCQLIAGFLQPDPLKRYSLEQARATRWLRNRVATRSMPKYDLKDSFGKLLKQRRQSASLALDKCLTKSTLSQPVHLAGSEFSPKYLQRTNRRSLHLEHLPRLTVDAKEKPSSILSESSVSSLLVTKNSLLSSEERETFRQLMLLGIDEDIISEHLDKGSLSHVVGIFRMVLHRVIREAVENGSPNRARSSNKADSSSSSNTGTPNGNTSRVNRSTSVHVTALDRIWSYYGRKGGSGSGKESQPKRSRDSKPASSVEKSQPKTVTNTTEVAVRNRNELGRKKSLEEKKRSSALSHQTSNGSSDCNGEAAVKRSRLRKMFASSEHRNANSNDGKKDRCGSVDCGGGDGEMVSSKLVRIDEQTKSKLNIESTNEENKENHRQQNQICVTEQNINETKAYQNAQTRPRTELTSSSGLRETTTSTTTTPTATNNGSCRLSLSKSLRTIKHLVTDNPICGVVSVASANAGNERVSNSDTSPEVNSGDHRHRQHHRQASSTHSSDVTTKSATLTTDQPLSLTGKRHHVLHKTATLHIVPNSCATFLLATPGTKLHRSQTTPDVSTCYYRQHYGNGHSMAKGKKSHMGQNRCTIV